MYTPITREDVEKEAMGIYRCDDPEGAAINLAWDYLEKAQAEITRQGEEIERLRLREKIALLKWEQTYQDSKLEGRKPIIHGRKKVEKRLDEIEAELKELESQLQQLQK